MLSRFFDFVGAFFNRLFDMLLFPLRGRALFSVRLLRRPGAWSFGQFYDLALNYALWIGIGIGFIVGGLLGYYSAILMPQGPKAPVFWGAVALAIFCVATVMSRQHLYRMRNFKLGFLAEHKTAEFLERLGRTNWRVIHGFEIRDGDKCRDIDHIVVCPHGVFCVETKAIRKFKDEEYNGMLEYTPPNSESPQEFGQIACFNGHQDESKQKRRLLDGGDSANGKKQNGRKNPLKQVKDNAGILREKLRREFPAFPNFYVRRIVVCPGWRVIRKGESWWEFVSSAEDLKGGTVNQFFAKARRELDDADIAKIAEFLEAQVREEKKEVNI